MWLREKEGKRERKKRECQFVESEEMVCSESTRKEMCVLVREGVLVRVCVKALEVCVELEGISMELFR